MTLTTKQWLVQLHQNNSQIDRVFRQIYGDRPTYIAQQKDVYTHLLQTYEQRYGESNVSIVRSPGRVNLVGMHVDHRGGHVNPIAVQEMTFVVGVRDDDQIHYCNANPRFGPGSFSISQEVPDKPIHDWTAWTQAVSDARVANGTAGDWANYIKAPIIYLQDQLRDINGNFSHRLRGMNIAAHGSVPVAAGLSSSSSVVVAAMEAVLVTNLLTRASEEIVELCGTAEWYIGTRGGKGDHAAIKLSRQGYLSRIGFFPLSVSHAPFPADYRIVVCNSLVEAKKSTGARDIFNQRVASYEIALMLLKHWYPQLRDGVEYFRDLLIPEKCHPAQQRVITASAHEAFLYELMERLPLRMARAQVESSLPISQHDTLQRLFQTHAAPTDGYRVRGVALFGLGECARSEMATQMLEEGDLPGFGQLMTLSHDGDRVSIKQSQERVPFSLDISEAALSQLRQMLHNADTKGSEAARIAYQPGAYAVSCIELDELVDTALSVDGVLGAGRIGAGLGGCISVLVHADQVAPLREALVRNYYEPRNLSPAVEEFFPVNGSGAIEFDGS